MYGTVQVTKVNYFLKCMQKNSPMDDVHKFHFVGLWRVVHDAIKKVYQEARKVAIKFCNGPFKITTSSHLIHMFLDSLKENDMCHTTSLIPFHITQLWLCTPRVLVLNSLITFQQDTIPFRRIH